MLNFSLSALSDSAYTLTVSLPKDETVIKNQFTFVQQQKHQNNLTQPVHDIASVNANIDLRKSTKMSNIFGKTAVQELHSFASKKLHTLPRLRDTLIVVDLRSKQKGYFPLTETDQSSLHNIETRVVDFFKTPNEKHKQSNAECFKQTAKNLGVAYLLLEGSLKATILKSGALSPSLLEHFTSKAGAADLCQFTEFFMNAAKFGHDCKSDLGQLALSPTEYIHTVSDSASTPQWTPHTDSTVHYPESYWGFHDSHNAPYARSIDTQHDVFIAEKNVSESDQLFSIRLQR